MPEPIVEDPPVTRCAHCEGRVQETVSTDYGDEVCPTCEDRFYAPCALCEYVSDRRRETDLGDHLCRNCVESGGYVECDRCSSLSDQLRETETGRFVCGHCQSRWYWECEGYYCTVLINSGEYCESCRRESDDEDDDGGCSCDACRTERPSDDGPGYGPGGLIRNYTYKPDPVFRGEGPTFFGMELEIESLQDRMSNARTATAHLGDLAYLKEDGSIGCGFEIVTHPMSYAWAMEHFPWQMLGALRADGADADGTGLHVHVSRTAFASPCHTYRWMKFLYRNSDRVAIVARRDSHQWAAFDDGDRVRVKHYAKGEKGFERYRAINTQNDHTFELRVFAASLEPQQVQAALGLAAASVEYTRHLTVTDIAQRGGWDWSAFTEWLVERDEYAPLRAELEHLACVC